MRVGIEFSMWRAIFLSSACIIIIQKEVLSMNNVIPIDYTNMTCQLDSGKEGLCVYSYLCQDETITIDGSGIIDIRFSDDCEEYFLKCCSRNSPCMNNTGTCVVKDSCAVDTNTPRFRHYKESEECDWNGYQCCPNDVLKQNDADNIGSKDREELCADDSICVAVDQCLIDSDGINLEEARHSTCSESEICCPQSQIRKNVSNLCEMIGGRCVQEGQCQLLYKLDVRTGRCTEPGFECCMDAIQTNTTQSASFEGRKCSSAMGTCIQKQKCNGSVYTDSDNECEGLVCCSSPSNTTHTSSDVTHIPELSSAEDSTVKPEGTYSTCVQMGGSCEPEEDCGRKTTRPVVDCGEDTVCCLPEHPKHSMEDATASDSNTIKECGFRNENGIYFDTVNRTNGESQYGEFPWMVAIMTTEKGDVKLICGGTLVDPEVVLTTAECVKLFRRTPHQLIVRAGEWDLGANMEPIPHQERRVLKIKSHVEFKHNTLINNIALLFLDDKFDLTPTINTICLPPQDFSIDNGELIATGWGTTPQNRTKNQQILKSISLPYIPNDDCERTLRRSTSSKRFKLHSSFICAGGEVDIDTCKGDAGSPVIFQIPDDYQFRYYAVGMVSWGIGCGRSGIPAMYTGIGKFRNWIDKTIEDEGLQVYYYDYQSSS